MVSPVAATADGLQRPGLAVHCYSGFENAHEGGSRLHRSSFAAFCPPCGAAGPHQADLTFPWATSEFRVGTVAILALEST